jgi:hypothetical protein
MDKKIDKYNFDNTGFPHFYPVNGNFSTKNVKKSENENRPS